MRNISGPRLKLLYTLALVALIFGAASVFSGGQVLFGPEERRLAAGNYVPFVVWFNFLAGFTYMGTGLGLLLRKPWSMWFSMAIAGLTLLTFAAFGIHVLIGGLYEMKTVGALALRSGLWVGIAAASRRFFLDRGDSGEVFREE